MTPDNVFEICAKIAENEVRLLVAKQSEQYGPGGKSDPDEDLLCCSKSAISTAKAIALGIREAGGTC